MTGPSPSPSAPAGRPTVSIAIASRGRPEILDDTLASIHQQTLLPEKIVLVVPTPQDLPKKIWSDRVETIVGPNGLCVQRNAGIKAIPPSTTYLAFFDDDFELRPDYLQEAVTFLEANPAIIGISGRELGWNTTMSREQAKQMIANYHPKNQFKSAFICKGKHFILYGCNMVVRRSVFEYELFDENLPLYSYAEDYEITMRLVHYGRIGRFEGCVGVHLVTPSGRVREIKRGYSQIANNWYFLKKGTVHLREPWATIRFWVICVGKTMLISLFNVLKRNPSGDWPGRLKGQVIGVFDIFRGRSSPQRVLDL